MQAKELLWGPLDERLYRLGWDYTARISKSRFELSRGRKIYILGAEKIRRVRGHKIFKAYLDEIAFFSTPLNDIWQALRPALADFKGKAIVCTTPCGKGTDAYSFFLNCLDTPGWKYIHWTTADNPYIDPEEIEAAKLELDEKSFKQEYLAEWQSFEGLAYYNFSENIHIKPHTIDFLLPITLAFDFNTNPTTLLISQFQNGVMAYKKEYSFANSSTEETIRAFCEDFKDHRDCHYLIRGDASGKSRHANTGRSDYHYIEEMLKYYGFTYEKQILPKNPPIIDRVKTVNGWLKPIAGGHKIEVDPSCSHLIRDLSSQELNGRHPSDKNNLGHKADAMGYDIYWQNLTTGRKKQNTVIF